jgi:hypothetical protein
LSSLPGCGPYAAGGLDAASKGSTVRFSGASGPCGVRIFDERVVVDLVGDLELGPRQAARRMTGTLLAACGRERAGADAPRPEVTVGGEAAAVPGPPRVLAASGDDLR